MTTKHHPIAILNQFPPADRLGLMRWLTRQNHRISPWHLAFRHAYRDYLNTTPTVTPDIQTRVSYTLLNEFGPDWIHRKSFTCLLKHITDRLGKN